MKKESFKKKEIMDICQIGGYLFLGQHVQQYLPEIQSKWVAQEGKCFFANPL